MALCKKCEDQLRESLTIFRPWFHCHHDEEKTKKVIMENPPDEFTISVKKEEQEFSPIPMEYLFE